MPNSQTKGTKKNLASISNLHKSINFPRFIENALETPQYKSSQIFFATLYLNLSLNWTVLTENQFYRFIDFKIPLQIIPVNIEAEKLQFIWLCFYNTF